MGKTSLMRLIIERLVMEHKATDKEILFYDLESLSDRQLFEDQTLAQERLTVNLAVKRYVFIDEFQRLPQTPSLLKYLHDHFPLLKFIVSGSSSLSIKNLATESLLGRALTFVVNPLSYYEFLIFKNLSKHLNLYHLAESGKRLSASEISLLSSVLSELLAYGGYPRAVLTADAEQKKNLLLEQINRYLEKDAQLLIRETSLPIFENLLALIAAQDGGLLNVTAIAKTLKSHQQTAERYLRILKETYLLRFLPAYSQDKTVEIGKMRKIYFNDIGYVNALNKNFSFQPGTYMAGQAAENFAFGELLKRASSLDSFYYWRTKQEQEVDFVWRRENKIVPIEVKSGNANTIPGGLKSFIRRYRSSRAYVLNWDIYADTRFDGCDVLFRPLWWPII